MSSIRGNVGIRRIDGYRTAVCKITLHQNDCAPTMFFSLISPIVIELNKMFVRPDPKHCKLVFVNANLFHRSGRKVFHFSSKPESWCRKKFPSPPMSRFGWKKKLSESVHSVLRRNVRCVRSGAVFILLKSKFASLRFLLSIQKQCKFRRGVEES